MAIDLFRVMHGLVIQRDDLSANANILVGTGLPGGDASQQDSAPIGSTYQRTDAESNSLQFYVKWSTANNSSADWKVMASKEYVDATAAGLSWREPVRVRDNTVYADNSAFPTTGTIDGVALNAGDRVLFDNVTAGGEENVWIWDGASWTEDTNAESDGDAILVNEGTSSDQQWTYDGTTWVLFGSSASQEELGFLRSFTGKSGPGSETPTYSSTDVITQSASLEATIGELDAAIGTQSYANDNIVADGEDVTTSINKIDTAIGDRLYTSENVVADGETITNSIEALDVALGGIAVQNSVFTGSNVVVAAGVTIDTLALTDATEAKWIVQVRETATPANRRSLEIHAMNDGVALADHTEYGVLELGSAIAGFDIDVDVVGADMRLRFTATNNVDYVVRRVAYTAF